MTPQSDCTADFSGPTELRLVSKNDTDALFALIESNRAFLREWINWLDTVSNREQCQQLLQHYQDTHHNRSAFHLGIFLRPDTQRPVLAGIVSLQAFDWHSHKAQLGYWIGAEFQGRGIATKAVKQLLDFAFNELGLNRLEIRCALENHRSQRIPERLGFQREGVLREAEWLYDHYVDHILYALLKKEFEHKVG